MHRLVGKGYGVLASIDFGDGYGGVFAASLAIGASVNALQSQGAVGFANGVASVRRTKGAWISDVPTTSLSISIEPSPSLFQKAVSFVATRRNEKVGLKVVDEAGGINWEFSECYVSELSFDVSQDSILALSLSLVFMSDRIDYSWGRPDTPSPLGASQGRIPYSELMPYWKWEISELRFVTGFSFSFTQPVTKQYSCRGVADERAPEATTVLFGLPEISVGVEKVIHSKSRLSDDEIVGKTLHATDDDVKQDRLSFTYGGKPVFGLEGCVPTQVDFDLFDVQKSKTTYMVSGMVVLGFDEDET